MAHTIDDRNRGRPKGGFGDFDTFGGEDSADTAIRIELVLHGARALYLHRAGDQEG